MPLDWKDMKRFYYLAGIVKAVALARKVKIRWGGDWDGDHDFKDQTFNDLVHFELA
jgi:peptidoglycan L-alanyl-D-glutamate endopeptidase CwlK